MHTTYYYKKNAFLQEKISANSSLVISRGGFIIEQKNRNLLDVHIVLMQHYIAIGWSAEQMKNKSLSICCQVGWVGGVD